jgi:hypothetical protein
MAYDLGSIVELARQYGIFEYYLPFVIVFAIFYGLLTKSKIFGSDKGAKNISAIISLAAALFIMAYTPVGITLTTFFATFFTQATVAIVTLIVLVMIVYLLSGAGLESTGIKNMMTYIVIAGILITLAVFISSGGPNILPGSVGVFNFGLSAQDMLLIFLIVITVVILWWMTRSEKKGE